MTLCKLISKSYQSVIEHCNEVLKINNSNVKALYRKSKAYYFIGDYEDAFNVRYYAGSQSAHENRFKSRDQRAKRYANSVESKQRMQRKQLI